MILFLFHLIAGATICQDSVSVSKNFRFTDGIYLNFRELQSNKPRYGLDIVELRFFTNPQTSLTQVETAFHRQTRQLVDLDDAWGICIDGIPYIHLPRQEIGRELPTFAALKLRGKICYFTYPDWRVKQVPVAAYNPLNGRPFLRGTVEREEEVIVEKMLHFNTGEIMNFDADNFLRWIQDDPLLVETVKELPPAQLDEKLFKCLLIYVDRNPVFLKNNKEN